MPYRNFIFIEEKPFHIISRAVDEKKIFANDADCYRFILQIYAANLGKPNLNLRRLDVIKTAQSILNGEEVSDELVIKEHPPLVHILDFALNVTHYHFHLLPTSASSVPLFIKKLNGGFAKYFNLKYNRKGSLFGSRYKSIPIETDFQLDAIGRYISIINPLDIYQYGWRENGLIDKEKALEFLKNYQFSSFPDKIGKRKSKILAPEELLQKYSLNENSYKDYGDFVKDFLEERTVLPKEFLEFV